MKFLDLYESETTEQNPITIETIMSDLEKFHESPEARAKFLNNIHRPGQQPDKAFTYGGDGKGKGAGGKSISYTADVGSNQPSNDFARIVAKIKDNHPKWKQEIEAVINNVKNSNQQQYIKAYFIPKVENPGARLTITGNLRSDNRVADKDDYEKFGKAMVFYAGKCVSKLTDVDTKIGINKFKEIMQGCFGAAPDQNGEDDSFLMQFKDLESKMKIDAAKNVIKSIHSAGTKDIEGLDLEQESYYSGVSYLINNKLFEANEETNFVECPKTIDEFSKNANEALRQAKAVAEKYPKQYKLWYETLRAAFDRGVEEYQKIERDPEIKEFINPITGEKEHRHGKAWGTGGPNGFIRDNPDLKAITDKIKQGTPGCEGVHGWDIFNFGPKLILTMFDALEKGGKIYQKLCDDLAEGSRMMKRSLSSIRPKDFDKLIKQYVAENKHTEAMEVSLCGVLCALSGVYKILGNGKIGQINFNTKTFNTENVGSETVIQVRIDELKHAIAQTIKEREDYNKWAESEHKKREERIKKLEAEISGLGNQKKDGISNIQDSYEKTVSIKSILSEAETETKNQKRVSGIEDQLTKKKEELEKLKSGKNDNTLIKLDNYIAVLDNYKQILGLEPYIKEGYNTINILFNPDAAEEQYSIMFNSKSETDEEETQVKKENVPLSTRLDSIITEYRLTEADEETVSPEEEDDDEDNNDNPKEEQVKQKEAKVQSNKSGNIDWIKRDGAQGLKGVYRIFAEGKDNVRFDLPVFKELAKTKTRKDAMKKVSDILNNLNNSLNKLKPVEPIVDGIVACNKIDNISSIPGCFEVVKADKADDDTDNDKEGTDEKKPEETRKSKLEQFKEMRESLIKEIDESSPLMTNIVGKLNDTLKAAKDDSWANTYRSMVNDFNEIAKKIFGMLYEIYKDSDGGKQWVNKKQEAFKNSNFTVRIWLLVSMVKYVISQLSDQIETEETEELKREQEQNASFKPVAENPELNEDTAEKHTINFLLKKAGPVIGSVDFNVLLPTDYKNDIYNLNKPDGYNSVEVKILQPFNLKKIDNTNGIYGILTHIINNKTIADAINTKASSCKKCVEYMKYLHTAKGNKENPDRNAYCIYGMTKVICTALNGLDAKTKELDTRKPAVENESAGIPEISSDTLMNEIYKYIRGN